MRVIGTVGLPGSGKGEAAAVAEAEGIPVVVMGDVIREECRQRGLDPAEYHGEIAGKLREEEGDDVIAERTIPRIRDAAEEADAEAVLVDGLRSMVEADRFREAFGEDFRLVAIEAPFDVRAERLGERGRDQSDTDLEALRERDSRELDLGLGETMGDADLEIDNTGSLEAFRDKVRDVLGVLGEAGKLDATADDEDGTTDGEDGTTTDTDDAELEADQ